MANVAKLRATLSDAIHRVAYGNERIIIEKKGKPVAVIVDMADYQTLLEHEARQDRADTIEAAEIMADPEAYGPWRTLDGTRVSTPKPSAKARRWLQRHGTPR